MKNPHVLVQQMRDTADEVERYFGSNPKPIPSELAADVLVAANLAIREYRDLHSIDENGLPFGLKIRLVKIRLDRLAERVDAYEKSIVPDAEKVDAPLF